MEGIGNRKRKHYIISSVVTILGVLILLAGIFHLSKRTQSIAYAIGGGFLVTGLVQLAETNIHKKRWEYEKAEEIADKWGISDIQEGRGRAEDELYTNTLQQCEDKLHIQAITLTRFRNDLTRLFEEKAASGVEIRLLLMDPDSPLCDWYGEIAPERSSLNESIEQSVEYYQSVDAEDLEVRYYNGLPNNYFRVDNRAFIGPYFVHHQGRSTTTILTDINKELGNQYKNNFDKLWEHSREPDIPDES